MGSGSWTSVNPNELGMIPRAFSDMFAHTDAARSAGIEVGVRVSFIEIHNEELRDLLDSGYKSNHLAIREDAEGGIFVAGAEEREVTCLDEILGHLERGTGCRSTASTHMNEHSSRSHAIFTVPFPLHAFFFFFFCNRLSGTSRTAQRTSICLRTRRPSRSQIHL
jgi:hypothetical protein